MSGPSPGMGFAPTAADPAYGRCANCTREGQALGALRHTITISYPGFPDDTVSWTTKQICRDCRAAAVTHLAQMKAAMEDRQRRGGQR